MFYAKSLRRLTIGSLTAVFCVFGQGALAHTGVKDEGTEGKSLYTAFSITHGCAFGPEGHTSTPKPVRAQGAVFPNGAEAVATKINPDPDGSGPQTANEEPINLADHIVGATGGLPLLSPSLIQDKDLFKKSEEVTDAANASLVRGFHLTKGYLNTTLYGLPPFRVTAPAFKPDSCAKRLLVRIAVANWCTRSQNTDEDDRVDVWMGRLTPKFNDIGVSTAESNGPGVEGYWTTWTVNRTSALPVSCGTGYDIAVSPTDTDIDTYLPIPKFWPAP